MKKSLTYALLRKIFSVGCLALMGFAASVYAQTDTLVVRGKIENLTFRLYRQAPEISVARVNILQPTREIVKVVQLKPDGSFELKMPLIFPKEECYLSYSSVVMPFLGAKGTVEVTIFADSLNKTDIPLRFGGLHAAINNQHAQFYVQMKKWLSTHTEKVAQTTDALKYWEHVNTESNRQIDFFRSLSSIKKPSPLLEQWVVSSIQYTAKAKFYEFLHQQEKRVPTGLWVLSRPSVNSTETHTTKVTPNTSSSFNPFDLDNSPLLTFSKADFFYQFGQHAHQITPHLAESSLPISKVASLILKYIPNLSPQDISKLQDFIQGGVFKTKDLSFLNSLYNKRRDDLEIINTFELYSRKFGFHYGVLGLDYLNAIFYVKHLYSSPLINKNLWYKHIRPTLQSNYYQTSLDELHQIESADSVTFHEVHDLLKAQSSDSYLIDLPGGALLHQKTYREGNEFWEEIKKRISGTPTYFIFWTNDEYGYKALSEARQFQASLPTQKLNFVFVSEYKAPKEVWVENVIKSRTRGLHLKLSENQNLFLENEWGINRVPFCVLIDANGKYIKRDAPLPADREGWDKIWNKVFGK